MAYTKRMLGWHKPSQAFSLYDNDITIYRKFSNKGTGTVSKEMASRGYLQSENRIICGWDMAKNVKFWVKVPLRK